MEKINVLFLAEELRIGGAETYFYTIENSVNRDKFNFFSMAVNGSQYKKLKYPEMFISYKFSNFDRYRKILNVCKEKNISVIHVNSLRLAFIAAIVKKKLNIKIIYTKHNLTVLEKISKSLYANFLNNNIDIINVICNVEKDYLSSIGVKTCNIVVIYNGIKIEDFTFIDKKGVKENVNIGILARVDKVKNHRLFIDIAEKIHYSFQNTYFFIGGDGDDKEKIFQLIKERNMDNYVKMCGYVKANDFLQKMDYSILVSQREVLPISIIEAMAKGVIVIAKDVGGIKELVDDSTGYLISGENVDDYVAAFKKSFESQNENIKILAARKKAELNFSVDVMLNKIEQLYIQCS